MRRPPAAERRAAEKQEVRLDIHIDLLLIISQSGNQEFPCSAVTLDCLARGIKVLDIAEDQ